ncbi:TetR/AcrR family transcriptional regulator [Kitasatospora sp. NPDC092948]|uniref:TetR/AcrR family transcriptional regulator n=1 Tax=Kitasatospora sp. NPDC092948 TaxID=3364088 RepID=UPI0037F3D249
MAAVTKGQRTAEDLKAAALRVIARQGYLAAKITDITAEAGRAAGSFYRYYTDKDDLLRAIAEDFMAAVNARVVEHAGAPHDLNTVEDVRRHVRSYVEAYAAHAAEMTGIYEASLVSEDFARQWESLRGRHIAVWAAHIGAARRLPEPDRDCELTAVAVVCMLEGFCRTARPGAGGGSAVGDAVEALTRVIAEGVLGRPAG